MKTHEQRTAADEQRAELSAAKINDLPDSAFAFIEDGGTKDADESTPLMLGKKAAALPKVPLARKYTGST